MTKGEIMKKTVIFDLDGTLANTEHDGHLKAFNEAFYFFGLDWHWDSELYGDLLSRSCYQIKFFELL